MSRYAETITLKLTKEAKAMVDAEAKRCNDTVNTVILRYIWLADLALKEAERKKEDWRQGYYEDYMRNTMS